MMSRMKSDLAPSATHRTVPRGLTSGIDNLRLSPMELSALVDDVRRRVPAGDALGRLDAALTLSTELEADADAVVHHFVQEARSAGHSWTAIGQRLGVSKQAARQRFVESRSRPDGVPQPPRSTPRLVRCLEAARQEAAGAGAA